MRIFLFLLSLSLIGLAGCNQITGASYPTGYNTPAAGEALLTKSYTLASLSCPAATSCNAIYTNNPSAGVGLAVDNGTTKIKIFKAISATEYTVQVTGGVTCSGTTSGGAAFGTSGSRPIIINNFTGTWPCSILIGNSVTAYDY